MQPFPIGMLVHLSVLLLLLLLYEFIAAATAATVAMLQFI